jgi:hypothetical protein
LNDLVEERPDDILIKFTKQFYNEHRNKKFPQEKLCTEINKKFNTYYKNINHIVQKFYKLYPEYREERKNVSNLINQYILKNWDLSNVSLSNKIKNKFEIFLSSDYIQTKRLKLDKNNVISVNQRQLMDNIEQWIIKEENWYQTDQWKIKKIKELFGVEKTVSSIRHISNRRLKKYSEGIKREDGSIYYLTSPYQEEYKRDGAINEYIKKNWEKNTKILAQEIKEKFQYEITFNAVNSRKLKIKNDNTENQYQLKQHHIFTQEENININTIISQNIKLTIPKINELIKKTYNINISNNTLSERRKKILSNQNSI